MLKRKYLKTQAITHVQKKPKDSQFWSGLMKVKDSFLSLGRFKLDSHSVFGGQVAGGFFSLVAFPLIVRDRVQEKCFGGYGFQLHSTKCVPPNRLGRQ
jgi:hypothetical protein